MDKVTLKRANALSNEIKEIDDFISSAEKVWTGKLVSASYGLYKSKEYELSTDLKNKMLAVLRDHKSELEKEFNNL